MKGAVRPKSFFLGQYDLNYTCEILYYARERQEAHALREAFPLSLRDALRSDYRSLALAGYCRRLMDELAPIGEECRDWFALLNATLDRLAQRLVKGCECAGGLVGEMVRFDLETLRLSGLSPDFSKYDRDEAWSSFWTGTGSFGSAGGGRQVRVAKEVAEFLRNPSLNQKDSKIPLDAARVIGVFYQFHLDCASDVRRMVVKLIS